MGSPLGGTVAGASALLNELQFFNSDCYTCKRYVDDKLQISARSEGYPTGILNMDPDFYQNLRLVSDIDGDLFCGMFIRWIPATGETACWPRLKPLEPDSCSLIHGRSFNTNGKAIRAGYLARIEQYSSIGVGEVFANILGNAIDVVLKKYGYIW